MGASPFAIYTTAVVQEVEWSSANQRPVVLPQSTCPSVNEPQTAPWGSSISVWMCMNGYGSWWVLDGSLCHKSMNAFVNGWMLSCVWLVTKTLVVPETASCCSYNDLNTWKNMPLRACTWWTCDHCRWICFSPCYMIISLSVHAAYISYCTGRAMAQLHPKKNTLRISSNYGSVS